MQTQLTSIQLWSLSFVVLVMSVGQSAVYAFLPPLGREVSLNELQIATLMALPSLIYAVASPWWGGVSYRIGRKPVILICCFAYTIGALIFAGVFMAAVSGAITGLLMYGIILVVRTVHTAVMSGGSPVAFAYGADCSSREQRTRTMAQLATAGGLGAIIGPAMGGLLASINLLYPLVIAALLTAIAGLWCVFRLPDLGIVKNSKNKSSVSIGYLDKRIVYFVAIAIGMHIGFSSLQQTLAFLIQDRFHLSGTETAQTAGIAFMVSAICSFLAKLFIVQRVPLKPLQFITIGFFALLIAAVIIAWFRNLSELYTAMAIIGAGLGIIAPSISAAVSLKVNSDEQGAAAGLMGGCTAIGFVIGPLIAGAIYPFGSAYPAIFSSGIFFMILLTLIGFNRRFADS